MWSELVNNLDNKNMRIVSGFGLQYDSIFNICLSFLYYIKVTKLHTSRKEVVWAYLHFRKFSWTLWTEI